MLGNGMFEPALKEVEVMLRIEGAERDMLNHFKNNGCDIPDLVLDIMKRKAAMGLLTAGDVKYTLLMVSCVLFFFV